MIQFKGPEERKAWGTYAASTLGAFLAQLIPADVADTLRGTDPDLASLIATFTTPAKEPTEEDKAAKARVAEKANAKLLDVAAGFADAMLVRERERSEYYLKGLVPPEHKELPDPG